MDVDPDPGKVDRVKLDVIAVDGGTEKRAESIKDEQLGAVNDGWEGNAARGTIGSVDVTGCSGGDRPYVEGRREKGGTENEKEGLAPEADGRVEKVNKSVTSAADVNVTLG